MGPQCNWTGGVHRCIICARAGRRVEDHSVQGLEKRVQHYMSEKSPENQAVVGIACVLSTSSRGRSKGRGWSDSIRLRKNTELLLKQWR